MNFFKLIIILDVIAFSGCGGTASTEVTPTSPAVSLWTADQISDMTTSCSVQEILRHDLSNGNANSYCECLIKSASSKYNFNDYVSDKNVTYLPALEANSGCIMPASTAKTSTAQTSTAQSSATPSLLLGIGTGINLFSINGSVSSLTTDSAGNVYAGGSFTIAGGVAANRIAKWNAATSTWAAMGTGMNGSVSSLTTDSAGNVYAGGSFTTAGGVAANYIAKWNAATSTWTAMGTGMWNMVYALTTDSAGNVYAGGYFGRAGGVLNTSYIAK